jgi:lipopolysaccharide transport system permease protein
LSTLHADTPTPPIQHLKLRPKVGWQPIDISEIWRYRELLWTLAVRDIQIRYKQTALGALWAIIPPVFNMLIFTWIFTVLFKTPQAILSNGLPYAIFSFTAMVPWQLFANSLTQAGNSLVGSQNLITKVYFPRLVIPISSILSAMLDFLIAMVILLGLMLYYHNSIHPGIGLLALPFFIVLAIATALAAGLWLSALNVEYRDIRYIIPFLVQFWMYASPVIYSSDRIPAKWRPLYSLNPMAGVIDGFRWALLGSSSPPLRALIVSLLSVTIMLIGGLFYFRRMEKTFADLV